MGESVSQWRECERGSERGEARRGEARQGEARRVERSGVEWRVGVGCGVWSVDCGLTLFGAIMSEYMSLLHQVRDIP